MTTWRCGLRFALAATLAAIPTACVDDSGGQSPAAAQGAWDFGLPKGFPQPKVPADNPMSAAKVELGRRLFYDKRLSGNQTQSCATCHQQQHAFADDRAVGVGSTGQAHVRGAMSLANVAYATTLTWANPTLSRLEKQALVPMFGDDPVELGMGGREKELLERLRTDSIYPEQFRAAFGSSDPTLQRITQAIASFERTLVSAQSPWQRYLRGEAVQLAPGVLEGSKLFYAEELECFHCHTTQLFTDASTWQGKLVEEQPMHNNGLYATSGKDAYPEGNQGAFDVTGKTDDIGKFKAPTLLNIAVTAPYMHDGSLPTLEAVIDHYAAGNRHGPAVSQFVKGFELSAEQKAQLVAFLKSLTDESFLTDPRFSDPFAKP